jgi:hypothetical protein
MSERRERASERASERANAANERTQRTSERSDERTSAARMLELTAHLPLFRAQLLTVTEENVLRFRHECFLMKNLSHVNVVKLVGVCWSEDM